MEIQDPGKVFGCFFLIVFLVALAAGEWVTPVGPSLWGFYWLPGLLATMVVAFLIAAAAATSGRSDRKNRNREGRKDIQESGYYGSNVSSSPKNIERDEDIAIVTMGGFFWILIILLLIIIAVGVIV